MAAYAVPVTGKDFLSVDAKVAAVPVAIHAAPVAGTGCGRSAVPFRCSRIGLYTAALLLAIGTLVAQAMVMAATGHFTFYTLNNSYSGYNFSNFISTYTISIKGRWLAKEPYLVIAVGSVTAALALVHLVFLFFPIVSASLVGAVVEAALVPLALCLWLAAVGVLGKTVHVFKDTAGYWPNTWERGSIAALVMAGISVVVWGALLVLSILALKRVVRAWRAKQAVGGHASAYAPNGADAA